MKRSDVYPSNYLKCEDLEGRDRTLRIAKVTMEKLGEDDKAVAWFYNQDKGLVLNQTNWGTIEELYGEESDEWAGKYIILFPTKTQFGNKKVPAIRIRDQAPAPPNSTTTRTKNGKRVVVMTQADVDETINDDGDNFGDDKVPY